MAANCILHEINRFEFEDIALNVGIALHHGEVSYGNIGSGRRLDFTLIGPDVNLVSRIQAACGDLRVPLLLSQISQTGSRRSRLGRMARAQGVLAEGRAHLLAGSVTL